MKWEKTVLFFIVCCCFFVLVSVVIVFYGWTEKIVHVILSGFPDNLEMFTKELVILKH